MIGMNLGDLAAISDQNIQNFDTKSLQQILTLDLSIDRDHIHNLISMTAILDSHPEWRLGTKIWHTLRNLSWLDTLPDNVQATLYQWSNELDELDHRHILSSHHIDEVAEKHFMSHSSDHAKVSIMTIHHAKGLEFDHVYIPMADSSKMRRDRAPCAYQHIYHGGEPKFIMLTKERWRVSTPNHQWMGTLSDVQQEQEELRLLYVAITRAKKSCKMLAYEKQCHHSIAKRISEMIPTNNVDATLQESQSADFEQRRLVGPEVISSQSPSDWRALTEDSKPSLDRAIGTIVHDCLFRMWHTQIHEWPVLKSKYSDLWAQDCKVMEHKPESVISKVAIIIQNLIACTTLKWIIKPRHGFDEAEWFCSAHNKTYVIDRIFEENQTLHIVDYKLRIGDHIDIYRQQLCDYKRVVAAGTSMQIKTYIFDLESRQLIEIDTHDLTIT